MPAVAPKATALASLIWLCAAANAQSETPRTPAAEPAHCAGAAFGDDIGLARVARSRPKVNFVRGAHASPACPSLSDACRDRPFLMAGDVVLTTERHGEFVCADYVNAKAIETIGWLPQAALEPLPLSPVPSAGWLGAWSRIEARITIKPAPGGALAIEGTAVWGSHDRGRVARGAVHNGEIAATVKPAGDVVFFSDEPAPSFDKVPENVCAVRMRRIGPYLVVEDNRSCGGMNVSFSGIYVRR